MKGLSNRRRKTVGFFAAVSIVVLASVWFGLSRFFTHAAGSVAEPIFSKERTVQTVLGGMFALIKTKASLVAENRSLKERLGEETLKNEIIQVLMNDNRELVNRYGEWGSFLVRAEILAVPPASLYDTVLLDQGTDDGILPGDLVRAPGGAALGRIESVEGTFSRARLFSSVGVRTEGLLPLGGESIEIIGAGGGMMHVTVPKDFEVAIGDPVSLREDRLALLGIVEAVGERSAGSLKVLFIRAAANVQELGFAAVVRPDAPSETAVTHDEDE